MIWNIVKIRFLSKGWGMILVINNINEVDDIEWICNYCNKISYGNFLKMIMIDFNELILDLIMVN